MTSLEQLLRDAMDEHTSWAPPVRTGMAEEALRCSRRTRRLQAAAVGGTSVAAAAVVVASASLGGGPGTPVGTPGGAAVATTTTPAPAPTSAASPWVVGATFAATPVPGPSAGPADGALSPNDPAAKGSHGPAALDAVTLRDPAPGFPLRRQPDAGSQPASVGPDGGIYWTKSFLVGVTPGKVSTDGQSTTPTGPEVTIEVIDGGPRMAGTVVGHTHVNGQAAVLMDSDNRHGLLFGAGKLDIQVWGSSTVTSDQLVALASAVRGLPS